MSVAVERGNVPAMAAAIVAMVLMIVALDQLLWRPTVVWAQKFRIEDTSQEESMDSWFLDLLHHSHILRWTGTAISSVGHAFGSLISRHFRGAPRTTPGGSPASAPAADHVISSRPSFSVVFSRILFFLLAAGLVIALSQVVRLLTSVRISEWLRLLKSDLLTLVRVTTAIVLGTLWTLPIGLRIGLSPRLSRIMQPIVQIAASFPAPMLFPAVTLLLSLLGVSIGFGSVVLMLLGTQWYILFNVIAGAQAIPSDLKEAAASYGVTGRQRLRSLYLPAIFPYLVTGWVTATGGAWNASIVAEIVTFRGETLRAAGIGSVISEAAFGAKYAELAAAILIMSLTVVLINRFVWHRLYAVASTQYNLSK
jgi:NitT/TauT family transport system permease protein